MGPLGLVVTAGPPWDINIHSDIFVGTRRHYFNSFRLWPQRDCTPLAIQPTGKGDTARLDRLAAKDGENLAVVCILSQLKGGIVGCW